MQLHSLEKKQQQLKEQQPHSTDIYCVMRIAMLLTIARIAFIHCIYIYLVFTFSHLISLAHTHSLLLRSLRRYDINSAL